MAKSQIRYCYYRTSTSLVPNFDNCQIEERVFDFATHADRNKFTRFMSWAATQKVDVFTSSTQLTESSAVLDHLNILAII